jgi:hypothetical protein
LHPLVADVMSVNECRNTRFWKENNREKNEIIRGKLIKTTTKMWYIRRKERQRNKINRSSYFIPDIIPLNYKNIVFLNMSLYHKKVSCLSVTELIFQCCR